DQLLGRHLVDVLILDNREDLGEQPQLLVGGSGVRALAGDGAAERQGQYDEQGADHTRLLHEIPQVPDPLSSVVGAIVRGSVACPDTAPRNRGAALPASLCPPLSQSAVPASRRRLPSRACPRRARTA